MDHRQRYFARPGQLDASRGLFCLGVRLPPIHRSPPKREDIIPPSAVDLWRRKEAARKLKLPQVSNRGRPQLEPLRPQLEPLRPQLLLSGLETSRVSLPLLPSFQPSRPVQPRPPKAAPRRPFRTETGMDFGLFIKNSPGFPRYGAR